MSKTKEKVVLGTLLIGWTSVFLLAQDGDYLKGLSYYKQKQYAKAIEEFEKIVKANPKYESGFRILGDSYLRVREYDHAIEAFQNALRLKDDNYISYYGLALAYYNTARYTETISTLVQSESYARSPRDQYQLYRTRGSAHYNISEFEKAISDLERASAIQRGNPRDVLQLGISYYHLGNYSQAEKLLQQALALDPSASAAKQYLSQIRYQEGIDAIEARDYKRAVNLLRDYVDQNPQDGEALFNLGLARLFAKNLQAAEEEFLRAVELMPENWEVYDRLGYIYEIKKNYAKALQNYQKAHHLNPDSAIEESVKRIQERIRRNKS
ncbi:tetratricopeptide repeat protein [Acidobacteria bacterium AH-259-D05]|nr:tetratricopeptide repeat protein [Acidobacteria bacterium AH-259-D05]